MIMKLALVLKKKHKCQGFLELHAIGLHCPLSSGWHPSSLIHSVFQASAFSAYCVLRPSPAVRKSVLSKGKHLSWDRLFKVLSGNQEASCTHAEGRGGWGRWRGAVCVPSLINTPLTIMEWRESILTWGRLGLFHIPFLFQFSLTNQDRKIREWWGLPLSSHSLGCNICVAQFLFLLSLLYLV